MCLQKHEIARCPRRIPGFNKSNSIWCHDPEQSQICAEFVAKRSSDNTMHRPGGGANSGQDQFLSLNLKNLQPQTI